MAVIKNGILGGFSGKAGAVNGYRLMDQDIMRGPRNPRVSKPTEKELANQDKFGSSQYWLKPLKEVFRIGFQGYKQNSHGFNGAKSYISKNAMVKDDAGYHVDPALALISHGSLPFGDVAAARLGEGFDIEFTWDYNKCAYNDRAMVVAYDTQNLNAVYDTGIAMRTVKKATLKLNEEFAGKEVHLYLGFVSEDRKNRSISRYLGMVTMPAVVAEVPTTM